MLEHLTEAIVLDKEDIAETDGLIFLYTEKMGRVVAKARGLKKMLSKSNCHLEPLNFVDVRFVSGKNGYFQFLDAMPSENQKFIRKIKKSPEDLAKFLEIRDFIKETTFDLQPDFYLWQIIKKIFQENPPKQKIYRALLTVLGFDPQFAECGACNKEEVAYFYKHDHMFLCRECSSKIPKNEVILV